MLGIKFADVGENDGESEYGKLIGDGDVLLEY
jgi:hypothetical protein